MHSTLAMKIFGKGRPAPGVRQHLERDQLRSIRRCISEGVQSSQHPLNHVSIARSLMGADRPKMSMQMATPSGPM